MPNKKSYRVASIIKRCVSEYLALELNEPQIGFVTITDVEVTNELSFAKIYVTFMDNKANAVDRLESLSRYKGRIRSYVSRHLDTKKCPELIFIIDDSLEKGNRIERILDVLNRENG